MSAVHARKDNATHFPSSSSSPLLMPACLPPLPHSLRLFLIENKSCQFAPQNQTQLSPCPAPSARCAAQLWSPILSIYPILTRFICPAVSWRRERAAFCFFAHPNCKLLPRPFVECPFLFVLYAKVLRCCIQHYAKFMFSFFFFCIFFMTADT